MTFCRSKLGDRSVGLASHGVDEKIRMEAMTNKSGINLQTYSPPV